ncbi:MAG TPA: biotin--[acetyl-CoA-carboxylase] ligase [Acidimicrobiia bacterium]|nr:biotin--[acetyl-CoA-carboxylase] ligase [Acidimicrobiia bacterium]
MSREPASWSDSRLATTRFRDVRWFDVVDSTNRYLLECAQGGAPEGLVAVADEQTAGRGRLGRAWVAPPGAALLVSVLLRPTLAAGELHLVTLATALAALDALPASGARLKWPNDLVIGDRKLAGILAEVDGHGAVVVGMGLNVRDDLFPEELRAIAVAYDIDREELLAQWLVALDARLDALDRVRDDAISSSATIGRRVRVELPDETFEGVARALTPEGFLVVDDRVVSAGDVVHVRAED